MSEAVTEPYSWSVSPTRRMIVISMAASRAATAGNRRQIERERVTLEAREAEEKKSVEGVAARLADVEIVIARKVGETEALYGSVTAADIAEALVAKGFDIDRRKLQLVEPIKKLGEFDIPLRLHRDVVASVKVKVVGEGQ